MTIRLTKPVIAAATAVSIFLLIAGSQAQVAAPSAEIKVTVVDQIGARMPASELVFQGDAKPIMAHTGSNGTAAIQLPTGRYAVTASHFGFLKNETPDFR